MGSQQPFHSHPGRTKLLLTPACSYFMVFPVEEHGKDSFVGNGWVEWL